MYNNEELYVVVYSVLLVDNSRNNNIENSNSNANILFTGSNSAFKLSN